MLKKENAIDKKIVLYHGKNRTFYVFECNTCKTHIMYRNSDLNRLNGMCKKCADLEKLSVARKKHPGSNLRQYEALFNNLKTNAISKNIVLKLTYEEFLKYTDITNCEYCLNPVKWTKYNLIKNGYRYNLDRKNNEKGYEKDNLVVCCWKCNNSKGNRYTYEEWYGMTKYFRDKNE